MFFCPVQHSRVSFFWMLQLFFLVQREWLGIAQESRTTQASPRVDVDVAPYAPGNDLLYATELEDAHDLIKLRKSDDNLEFFFTETLPMPDSIGTSGQCNKTCLDDTYSAQSIAGIITCQFEKRHSFGTEIEFAHSAVQHERLELNESEALQSLLNERCFQVSSLASQICQTRALLEV